MADVEEFFAAPTVDSFNALTKDQLRQVSDHYDLGSLSKTAKLDQLQEVVRKKLVDKNILPSVSSTDSVKSPDASSPRETVVNSNYGLTFEQQKELSELQRKEREADRQLEYEKLKIQERELELARECLRLMADGRIPGGSTGQNLEASHNLSVHVSSMVKLLPKFNEREPDVFFSLFESVAEDRGWSDGERILLLQTVFVGKAQEAFIALSGSDRKRYAKVKDAVLKAYELVPEAYRQRFRNWKKGDRQSYTEVARELSGHFYRWLSAVGVETFDELCNLVIIEQFKNILPERIAMYISEHPAKTVAEAAVRADEFVLTHRGSFKEPKREPRLSGNSVVPTFSSFPVSRGYPSSRDKDPDACNYCLGKGHWKKDCPALKAKGRGSRTKFFKPVALAAPVVQALIVPEVGYSPFITDGFVSLVGSALKVPVKILRDTGASESFLLKSVLPFSVETSTGENVLVKGIGLQVITVPLHRVNLESDLVQGEVTIAVRPSLPVEGVHLILGNNLAGDKVWRDVTPRLIVRDTPLNPPEADVGPESLSDVFTSCAVTRAKSRATDLLSSESVSAVKPVSLPVLPAPVSPDEFVAAQKEDRSLDELFSLVLPAEDIHSVSRGYFLQDGLLVRKWLHIKGEDGIYDPIFQIVVPLKFRDVVLKTAHGSVSGHLGVKKTYDKVMRYFYWPRLKKDVACFIKTCHICQLTGKPNAGIKPAPLYPIPSVGNPFEHLIIDCVGPLPPSKSGCVYLLTVMCRSTRYPAAYPLRIISTKSVVKALSQFISIFGIPQSIQSDRGSNFTSRMFAEVLEQLRVKHHQSTAYHAQSQGALERFHQTLKSLLRAYCVELNRDWEEGLPWLMLAAREVTQVSTGFSPNDLVFGHKVRGPLAVLQGDLKPAETPVNLLDYVNGFRRKLLLAGKMAMKNLTRAQQKMKSWYDRRAEPRVFSPGDQVLALLPIIGSPFLAKFSGPYTVVRQVSELNYLISTPERKKSSQLCHVNLLKPYFPQFSVLEPVDVVKPVGVAVAEGPTNQPNSSPLVAVGGGEDVVGSDDGVLQPRLKNSEKLTHLHTLIGHLPVERAAALKSLICEFPSLFADTPSRTHLIEHDIDTADAEPIRQRIYRVSVDKQSHLESEVQYLLDNGLARPSNSSWASPCVLVTKPDGTYRLCTDYRKLNNITKADSFPLPRVEDCVDRVGSARFVSKFDLLKGYYQVPLSARAQEVSAFITPTGLYSYTVMSFGLRNAPATFQRLMNMVVSGLKGCAVYLDDAVTYSDTWPEHLNRIRALFARLADARLTINLAKCEFAQATVEYLGKVVGQGQVRPLQAKVRAIHNFPVPVTKSDLRRFLGMVGYYRNFCLNFSSVAAPLTNLLKTCVKYEWTPACQVAFDNVKMLLTSAPVLMAPRFDLPFQMQVDASNVGAGAVLLQQDEEGVERPVCFFSRKFNRHQLNYSTIEKETLAIIWGLQYFDVYLGGGSVPVIVYSDHNPLTFLHSLKSPSQRLMRWALFLQPYSLQIKHISGVDNVIADALSRAPCEPEL
ncbi:hypothetical protein ACEWY4_022708 [Coilia grayii]|uniref:Gypsy retrotransposon integrase-like protein 1 n=1 Tax=Coilia grayii TaxID=363190 RepID=A0ABD1J0X5_9TELE